MLEEEPAMKKVFSIPELEATSFDIEDVITTVSGAGAGWGEGWLTEPYDNGNPV